MNTFRLTPSALPLALPSPQAHSRRRQVAQINITDSAMAVFNAELKHVHEDAAEIVPDQLASLARWLQRLPDAIAAATLSQRLARVETLRRMVADKDWQLSESIALRAQRVLDYVYRRDDLIPDDMPLFGHLDDALLVELTWQTFADEARDYGDFCNFRQNEPLRRKNADHRLEWENDCLARANALLHRRDVQSRGYSPRAEGYQSFRVC